LIPAAGEIVSEILSYENRIQCVHFSSQRSPINPDKVLSVCGS
jgi:hypothetical protein